MSTRSRGYQWALAVTVIVLCLLVLGYSLIVAGQILLGVLFCVFILGLLLAYRLLGAFFRLVDAVERIADALERGDGARQPSSRRSARGGRSEESRTDGSRDHVDDRW